MRTAVVVTCVIAYTLAAFALVVSSSIIVDVLALIGTVALVGIAVIDELRTLSADLLEELRRRKL